jgi:hypothetical protein
MFLHRLQPLSTVVPSLALRSCLHFRQPLLKNLAPFSHFIGSLSDLLGKSTILTLDVDLYPLDDVLRCRGFAEATATRRCSFIAALVLHFLVRVRTYSRVVDIPTARTAARVLRAVD